MIKKIHNSFAFRFPVLFYKNWLTYVSSARPTTKALASGFNLVILCGARHYPFLKQTLFSIQKNFEKLPNLYVFTDFGTLAQSLLKIEKLYPADKLHIITADECVAHHTKSGNILLRDYALKSPMGLKLAAIMQIAELGLPLIYADTDVLWLSDPTNDINHFIKSEINIHMSYDYQPGYDFNLIKKGNLEILNEKPYQCAGLMFINKFTDRQRSIIDSLLPIVIDAPGHLSEQTIFAYVQKNTGVSEMSDDKYLLFYSDQFDIVPLWKKDGISRHYIGPVRHLFWRDAFFKKMWRF